MAEAPPSSESAPGRASQRILNITCTIGLLALGLADLYVIIVPLFALTLGASATEIGLLTGARALLPAFMAIHGGSLMDRLGTRRVMLGCSLGTAILAIMIPALPWFWVLLLIQAASGLVMTFNWIGAQTLVAQLSNADTAVLGRFNFMVRFGTISSPIIAGLLWDFGGAWPTFCMVAAWAMLAYFLLRMVPEPNADLANQPAPSLRAVLPRVSDYTRSFALMTIPVICFTVIMWALRNSTTGVQISIYVVYLEQIGLQGTAIGVLFSALDVAVGLASLMAGKLRGKGRAEWLLIGLTLLGIVSMSVTPFLGGIFALLVLMQLLRGGAQGLMQPFMASLQSRMAGKDFQGAVVGLRMTAVRISGVTLPPIMGFFADAFGLEMSFVLTGLLLAGLVGIMGLVVWLRPEFRMGE
jgi:MFS family permease